MRVSFCIPAHDEELLIGATVGALAHAGRELKLDHEIVVACDACADQTATAARAAGARVVEVQHRQISRTRNSAAAAATGDVLIFVDADTIVPVTTVRETLEALGAGAIGGGAGAVFDGAVPFYARLMLPSFVVLFRVLRLTGGAYFFCTREAFEAAGRWDETVFAGEEVDLARKMHKLKSGRRGFVIVREPIVTSGRKLRTYRSGEVLGIMLRAILRPSTRFDRTKLDIWYGPRREDPTVRKTTPQTRPASPTEHQ